MSAIASDHESKQDSSKSFESLSRDILNENLIRLFSPFYFVQKILGSCRVDVRDRFVTPPTVMQKCYSLVLVVLSMYSTFNLLHNFFVKKLVTDRSMITVYMIGVFALFVVCLLNVIHVRFVNNAENVKLLLTMQQIDRVMKIDNFEGIYGIQIKRSFMAVGTVVLMFISSSLVTIFLTWEESVLIEIFGPAITLLNFGIELAYFGAHLMFFINRISLINHGIINHFENEIRKKTLKPESIMFSKLAAKWQDFESNEMDVYIEQILSGFFLFQKQQQFQVTAKLYV